MTPFAILLLASLSPLLALALIGLGVLSFRQYRRVQQLLIESRHDPLTGLPNRRGLEARWAAMAGDKALILIDLVGFKAVNDSHGHLVGDALLKQVAGRLESAITPPGVVARWGGDEFVALIPADRVEAQQALLENARILAYDLSVHGGPDAVWVGTRTGVSLGERDLERAMLVADRALMETGPTARSNAAHSSPAS